MEMQPDNSEQRGAADTSTPDLFDREKDSSATLRTLLNAAPLGILIANMSGAITFANPEAERIWEMDFAHVAGGGLRHYRLCYPDGTTVPPEDTAISRVLAGEERTPPEERIIVRPNDSRVWVETTSTLVRDDARKPVGVFVMFCDITERKLAEHALKSRADREEVLHRISKSLLSSNDPEIILASAMRDLGQALQADRCFYSRVDAARDWSRIGSDWCRPHLRSIAGEYKISDFGIDLTTYFAKGETRAESDVLRDNVITPPKDAEHSIGLRSTLSVPIFDQNVLVAIITAAMSDKPRTWTMEEQVLVESVAAQIRSTVEGAKVRQRDHTIAQTLQDALLPPLPGNIPGMDLAGFYQPALDESNIGGDFYDVFPLDSHSFVFVVGDVSGKGLKAAAQVATVRNMLRYAVYQNKDLSRAIEEVNGVIASRSLLTGFATVFVGQFDTSTRLFKYVSCGQEPGLIYQAASDAVVCLSTNDPILGASVNSQFNEYTIQLQVGDAIALYTDGLTESGPSRKDLLGVPAFIDVFRKAAAHESANQIVESTIYGVKQFSGGPLLDDACLLVAVIQ